MTKTLADTIDILSGAGFVPTDDIDTTGMAAKSILYYGNKGWDAVRIDTDGLAFASFDDGTVKLMLTTTNGVITDEANFNVSTDKGSAMLIAAVSA